MRLIRGISGLITGLLLCLLLLLWIPGLCGYEVYYVSSGSMEPALKVADAIFVKQCGLEELQEGDIVTYALNQGETLITHRVTAIDRKKEVLQTKGDANSEADPTWFKADLIIGKVQHHLPYIGYLAAMLSSLTGKLFLLAVFLWLLAVQAIADQWITPRRKDKKI